MVCCSSFLLSVLNSEFKWMLSFSITPVTPKLLHCVVSRRFFVSVDFDGALFDRLCVRARDSSSRYSCVIDRVIDR